MRRVVYRRRRSLVTVPPNAAIALRHNETLERFDTV